MHLEYRQHLLLFDLLGLGFLVVAAVLAFSVAVLLSKRKTRWVPTLMFAFLLISLFQFYRGWMAPPRAWLPMLGALEVQVESPGSVPVADFSKRWDVFYGNMRAVDWWLLSGTWNVCHGMWEQGACANPKPSEDAVGVTREIIEGAVTKYRARAVRPNPSLERRATGMAPGPRGAVAYPAPRGPGAMPVPPAQLKR